MKNFKTNDRFFYYLYFIKERMDIFWNRYNKQEQPWTDDPIFQDNKFTNVYRVLDRSSQYLIRNVIYNDRGLANDYDTEDIFWRILLYKHFNLPETWDALINEFGDITLDLDYCDIIEFLKRYERDNIVYSNAYMLTAAFMRSEEKKRFYGLVTGMPKYELYFRIFDKDLFDGGLMYKILKSKNYKEAFDCFLQICGVADFLAYQYVQDLNYSVLFNFDDNSFCAIGPGTERGIKRTFILDSNCDFEDIVKWVAENYDKLVEEYSNKFDFDLKAKLLPNWGMKVPDFSNCFCETDKYMRGLGVKTQGIEEGRIKQKFIKNINDIDFVFPPKWGVIL